MLSSGPYNYNRFAQLEEQKLREKMYFMEKAKKAKPDFLDVDKDGNEDESFKKALKDKKGGKDDEKKDVKEACECDDNDEKKSKKKKIDEWVIALVNEGFDLSKYDMADMEVMYDAAIRENREMAYGGGKPGKGSGDGSKPKGLGGSGKTYTMKGKDGKPLFKEDITRTDVIDYLMESGFTNNPVSSEVLIDNMSDAWLNQIIEDLAS